MRVLSGSQCRQARMLLKWNVRELSMKSGVTASRINHFESGRIMMYKNEAQFLVTAFDRADIQIAEDGDVSLKKRLQDNEPSTAYQKAAANDAEGVLQRLLSEQGTD